MKRILILLLLVISSSFAQSQCSPEAYKNREVLNYDCYYNWAFIWVKAGSADVKIALDENTYDIVSTCTSASGWDWFFKLRDTMAVTGNAKTILPYRFKRVVNESSYHARFEYDFNYDSSYVKSNGFKKKDIFINKMIKIDTPALDIVSFSWLIRGLDFSKYKKNEKIPVRMLISNEVYNLFVRYKGVETIKLKSGEKIECYKIVPMLIKGTTFSGGESMFIWVTKDKNKVPVMMQAEVVVGSIKAVLSSYDNMRFKSHIFPHSAGTMGEQID